MASSTPGFGVATGEHSMGKMPEKPEKKSRTSVHKYFAKDYYIGSNEVVMARFERALAELNESGYLSLLDQGKMTKQTLLNVVMLWLGHTIGTKGVKAVEKELRPVMDELGKIVAAEMQTRGREVSPAFLPEGFKLKKPKKS